MVWSVGCWQSEASGSKSAGPAAPDAKRVTLESFACCICFDLFFCCILPKKEMAVLAPAASWQLPLLLFAARRSILALKSLPRNKRSWTTWQNLRCYRRCSPPLSLALCLFLMLWGKSSVVLFNRPLMLQPAQARHLLPRNLSDTRNNISIPPAPPFLKQRKMRLFNILFLILI